MLAEPSQTNELRSKYLGGNFGYGHAKKELLELILSKFVEERKRFDYFMTHTSELENQLQIGEQKAKQIPKS